MRSSKSRSRSKANRPRSLGNIVNRVFDSSGPEGKVRGTPQQIIEKYTFLARDAQLSNDRVAAENFLQHAEHYTRMLAEAQREMAAEQEARRQGQDGQNGQGGGQHGQRNDRQDRSEGDDRGEGRNEGRSDTRGDDRNENRRNDQRNDRREGREDRRSGTETSGPAAVIELDGADDGAGLVETPEARRNQPERERGRNFRRRDDGQRNAQPAETPAAEAPPAAETRQDSAVQGGDDTAPDSRSDNVAETAAEPKPRAPRRPRSPRKPKTEGDAGGGEGSGEGDPRAAAE